MKRNYLIEVPGPVSQAGPSAFDAFHATAVDSNETAGQVSNLVANLSGFGLTVNEDLPPVPMFDGQRGGLLELTPMEANGADTSSALAASTLVVACELDPQQVRPLEDKHPNLKVWPNSDLTLLGDPCCAGQVGDPGSWFGTATTQGGVDCRPFESPATLEIIRQLLDVRVAWQDGFRGQNTVVAIVDEGVDGTVYPVVGGFSLPRARRPGSASVSSHGSMCAADVLVAAPEAKLYDYPFLNVPNSGGALVMYQAILNQRRLDGTPHVTNSSYGYVSVPSRLMSPNHEVHNSNHPVARKVREAVAAGITVLFAAGNCGGECPSSKCHNSGIGPGRSIHASNSLKEVITVAAVNRSRRRIGYSSQGPGIFFEQKPDFACYSHFYGNFGPGRPAGGTKFDDGTSAATPVAAGVVALLLSAFPHATLQELRQALVAGAIDVGKPGWDYDTGFGVISAGASYTHLRHAIGHAPPLRHSRVGPAALVVP